ncbi:MAG: hypothetical protein ACRCY5_02070 [Phocaeicola sp.]
MYASDIEEIEEQVILIVEVKREFRLANRTELAKAQRQTRSYSIWTGCKFGLVTDSRVIQVLDIMPNLGPHKVLFDANAQNKRTVYRALQYCRKRNFKELLFGIGIMMQFVSCRYYQTISPS